VGPMTALSVASDVNGDSGITLLNVGNIIKLEYARSIDRVLVHTLYDVYYLMGTVKFWKNSLNNTGCNFMMVDRINAVNLNKVVLVNEIFKLAYFEESPVKNSKKCTIARDRYRDVLERLELINPELIYEAL
jgi:hypothetical protein